MIHPHTELKKISESIGYGVFATQIIPAGTIVYVKDSLEKEISPKAYAKLSSETRKMVDKYSYIDPSGVRIISWDFAKYVNHCCNCNTISTGYGFEIALRDIMPGEEITDEYGLFNLDEDMNLECGFSGCRKRISNSDFDKYYPQWDEKIKAILPLLFQVNQPLFPLLDKVVLHQLQSFEKNPQEYLSVFQLKCHQIKGNNVSD